ncbi:hypothetical protein P7C71_g6143, partial [Lecanoromycetidae sp. Uapishka_2]
MHGLFGSKQNNRSISKALARDLKTPVYALVSLCAVPKNMGFAAKFHQDLRNHGDSPHDANHDYQAMADDVEEFVDEHGLKLPTLIGHSMGAKVAMTLALRSPKLLGALIAVDNAPVDANLKSDFRKYVQGMRDIEEKGVNSQAEADAILRLYEEALPIRQFLLTNLTRSPDGGHLRLRIPTRILAASLDKMGDFPFRDPEETRFDGPTLIVRGTKSHYVADDVLPVIGQFFPRFKLRDIESGHWVISEKPEIFRQAVVEFLQERRDI